MTSSEWAAWVQAWSAVGQAFFSVVAIVAAIIIAKVDRNDMRNQNDLALKGAAAEKASRARDHGLILVIPIAAWSTQWNHIRKSLALADRDLGERTAIDAVDEQEQFLSLPKAVRDVAGRLSELGPAASAVQNLVHKYNVLFIHKPMIHSLARGDFVEEELAVNHAAVVMLIRALADDIQKAEGKLFALLPAPE